MDESRVLSEVLLATVADDDVRGLDPDQYDCVLHDYHSPVPWVLHAHHVVPLSWTRALGMRPSGTIPACATGHEALHAALRRLVLGQEPARQVDEKVTPWLEQAMAFWSTHHERLAALDGVVVERTYATERDDEVRAPARRLSRFARQLLGRRGDPDPP